MENGRSDLTFDNLRLGKTDRGVLIGATGCGKTTLARYLIEDKNKPYSVVYDAKLSDAIGKWRHVFYTDFESIQQSDERRLIYRPSFIESISPEAQDDFFQWVYNRHYTRLYIDEAYALLGGSNPSFHLQACLSRGRERGISTLIATQRPKRIPLIAMSESEHIYVFRLNLNDDRQRTEELTGISIVDQISLRQYEFYYYNVLTGYRSNKLKLSGVFDNGTKTTTAFPVQYATTP